MRVKHFAGYGCVDIKKISDKKCKSETWVAMGNQKCIKPRIVEVKVTGDHECGLNRSEYYSDCYNWLLKRLCKGTEESDIIYIDFSYIDGENALYRFYLKTNETIW